MVSERAKKTVKNFIENGGKSVSKAMRDAGYSPATAQNPKKLTSTKTWQSLMDKYLPEEDLSKHHKELMNAKIIKTMLIPIKATKPDIRKVFKMLGFKVLTISFLKTELKHLVYFAMPDNRSRIEALDMAYKLRGKYAKTEHKLEFADTGDEELKAFIAGEISEIIAGN